MPILQSTWAEKPAPGIAGRRANMEEWNTLTREAESGDIGFAYPVQRGTEDHQVDLFTDGNFLGIAEADQTVFDGDVADEDAIMFSEGYSLPVCEIGVLWVNAGGTATAGNPVYWDASTATYSDDDGDTLIPGAEFDSSGAGGSVVKVRLRRQVPAPDPAS